MNDAGTSGRSLHRGGSAGAENQSWILPWRKNAMTYLYLGSALQDSGKWKEGIEAYSDCVRNAKKGPVHECAAMGGRK